MSHVLAAFFSLTIIFFVPPAAAQADPCAIIEDKAQYRMCAESWREMQARQRGEERQRAPVPSAPKTQPAPARSETLQERREKMREDRPDDTRPLAPAVRRADNLSPINRNTPMSLLSLLMTALIFSGFVLVCAGSKYGRKVWNGIVHSFQSIQSIKILLIVSAVACLIACAAIFYVYSFFYGVQISHPWIFYIMLTAFSTGVWAKRGKIISLFKKEKATSILFKNKNIIFETVQDESIIKNTKKSERPTRKENSVSINQKEYINKTKKEAEERRKKIAAINNKNYESNKASSAEDEIESMESYSLKDINKNEEYILLKQCEIKNGYDNWKRVPEQKFHQKKDKILEILFEVCGGYHNNGYNFEAYCAALFFDEGWNTVLTRYPAENEEHDENEIQYDGGIDIIGCNQKKEWLFVQNKCWNPKNKKGLYAGGIIGEVRQFSSLVRALPKKALSERLGMPEQESWIMDRITPDCTRKAYYISTYWIRDDNEAANQIIKDEVNDESEYLDSYAVVDWLWKNKRSEKTGIAKTKENFVYINPSIIKSRIDETIDRMKEQNFLPRDFYK